MNIELTEVLSDVMGLTGQAIIRAIVAGERARSIAALKRRATALGFQINPTPVPA